MIELSLIHILIALTSTLVLLAIFILIVLIRNNSRLHDITFPIYDYAMKEAKQEANKIVDAAHKKATGLIETAESRAVTIQEQAEKSAEERIARQQEESTRISTLYEKKLETLAQKNEELMQGYGQKLDTQYAQLEHAIGEQVEKSEKIIADASALLVTRIEESQKKLHEELSKEISGQLVGAFDEVEKAINAYRVKHMQLIDDQIISLVEQTTAIVLRKELPLRDQSEFIYRALEEVKQKGLFS